MAWRVISVTLVVAAAILIPSAAFADEIFLNTVSWHFTDKQPDNNVNPGLLYAFNNRVVAGTFLNTHRKMSFFGGYYVPISRQSTHIGRYKLTPGFIAGAATGYQGGISFGPIPTLRLGLNERVDLHLTVTPIKGGVISVAFGFKL